MREDERILETGRLATSANSRQAWKIVVATDADTHWKLARAL